MVALGGVFHGAASVLKIPSNSVVQGSGTGSWKTTADLDSFTAEDMEYVKCPGYCRLYVHCLVE